MSHNELISAAADVRRRAHAPYSGFSVGAAVLTASGDVFAACNVENASLGITVCAERAAVCAAVAAGHKQIVAVAVVADEGPAPCGACRQFLSEFGQDMTILMVDAGNRVVVQTATLDQLLPNSFRLAK